MILFFSFSKLKLVLILPSSKKLIDPFCSETVIDKQSVYSVIPKADLCLIPIDEGKLIDSLIGKTHLAAHIFLF